MTLWAMIVLVVGLAACNFAMQEAPTPTATPTSVPASPTAPSGASARLTPTPDSPATLAVPTPLAPVSEAQPTPRPTVSALQRIRDEGVLRVGVLYNAPPLSSLNERGQVVGYEADLARAIGEDWGVEVEFAQVTRQTAVPLLLSGEVDVLLASMVHRREDEAALAFSHTYFLGGQMLLVRAEDEAQTVAAFNGQRIGIVRGTSGERALAQAADEGRLNAEAVFYLTLDQAIGALGSGEVQAILADRVSLLQVTARVAGVRIIEEMVQPEPHGIAVRRPDGALLYLLERTLQKLYASGRLRELRQAWFPGVTLPDLAMPVWAGLDDDPRGLASFDSTMVYPDAPILTRIRAGEALRVAGLDLNPQASAFVARLEGFYRALVEGMAARWGVPVEFIPESAANALEWVAAGQTDLAVGVTPTWLGPYEVAYTQPVILHGDRLMVPINGGISGFADLRGGRWVGIFASEPGAADRANELAGEANARINIFTITNDEDAVYSMLVDHNIDVAFGDSLRLIPLVEANADLVVLTETWYSREYITMAVSRFDPDFLALVNVTLQDMEADGAFARLWAEALPIGEPITFEQWPGARGTFMGVRTGAIE